MLRLMHQVRALFFSFSASISQALKLRVSPPPADIELQHVTTQSAVAQPQPQRELPHSPPHDHLAINHQLQLVRFMDLLENHRWDEFVMSVCFMSIIQIATSAPQPQIPAPLYAFSLAISVSFSTLCIAISTSDKFPRASQWLRTIAISIAAAAFYLVAAMPLPMYLKWVVAAVFTISFLAVLLSHFL